jgi:primosomal protein N' (replication factor Y)
MSKNKSTPQNAPTTNDDTIIAEVAIASPVCKLFDYLVPTSLQTPSLSCGMRVLISFRNRQTVGIITALRQHSALARHKLKHILKVLDTTPCMDADLRHLCTWASHYYQHSLGEVLHTTLPVLLRQGQAACPSSQRFYQLTPKGKNIDPNTQKRAKKQQALLQFMQDTTQALSHTQLLTQGFDATIIKKTKEKQWLAELVCPNTPPTAPRTEALVSLNTEQDLAAQTIQQQLGQFKVFLLYGVTGSGKTAVYFHSMQQILQQQQQVLFLVPEISLTPQSIARTQAAFQVPVVTLHSQMSPQARLDAWCFAKSGQAGIVIGTRSAVFTPFKALGLIVIDEEHDGSFKQHDHFRYHARDIAIMRAKQNNIPIILGSATPSLESYLNAQRQRYQLLTLSQRANACPLPSIHLVDTAQQHMPHGLSQKLLERIQHHLQQQQQVLLFINRRGYAPVLFCQSCRWIAPCPHCDSRLVFYQQQQRLKCHHCHYQQHKPPQCPECQSISLVTLGQGTERLEESLQHHFPHTPILRIDRDSTQKKGAMAAYLQQIHQGGAQILIGTQMLAKGHHFANLSLTAILDIDGGLLSADYRATERTLQLILQVAGRAGREQTKGEVILQSMQTSHPLLKAALQHDYTLILEQLLKERQQAELPPFQSFAIIRAEAKSSQEANTFLQQVRQRLESSKNIGLHGPILAPMGRRANFHRMQLIISAQSRKQRDHSLQQHITYIRKQAKNLRWSLDVDPVDLY